VAHGRRQKAFARVADSWAGMPGAARDGWADTLARRESLPHAGRANTLPKPLIGACRAMLWRVLAWRRSAMLAIGGGIRSRWVYRDAAGGSFAADNRPLMYWRRMGEGRAARVFMSAPSCFLMRQRQLIWAARLGVANG